MAAPPIYLNPVHDRPAPDPFVLKFRGEYWCYSTGFWHDGRCFGVMRSTNLIQWEEEAGAMTPLPEGYSEYWAPEVSFWNGRFYMYYSCGDGVLMQLRVAVSDAPQGPFVDSGHRLSKEDFAIDAHVFEDDDGSRYLFYATDFLKHARIGTGTVVDQLLDPYRLAGRPRAVSRARYDWQIYDPHRLEKGGVRWHTVEGPFVLKFKGRYYQMYSGGNWQNTSYGVSYAVSPRIDTLEEWEQLEHSGQRPLVLRTLPGKVIGPGHNSVVRGPDNVQLFCVYHRWAEDGRGRLLAIDRLEWAGDRISVLGPSTTLQPAPAPPTISGFAGWVRERGEGVVCDSASARDAWLSADGAAIFPIPFNSYIVELSLRLEDSRPAARAGVALGDVDGHGVVIVVHPGGVRLVANGAPELVFELPPGFSACDFHRFRLEIDGLLVRVLVDGLVRWRGRVDVAPARMGIFSAAARALCSGFELTAGWQDFFMEPEPALEPLGWTERGGSGAWYIRDGQLTCGPNQRCAVTKHGAYGSYEAVFNVKLEGGPDRCAGIMPALTGAGEGPLFVLRNRDAGPVLEWRDARGGGPAGFCADLDALPVRQVLQLPAHADLSTFQQFRFRKANGRVACALELQQLGEVNAPLQATTVGLLACGAVVTCDSVRLSAFPPDRPERAGEPRGARNNG